MNVSPNFDNRNAPVGLTSQQLEVFELLQTLSTERESFHHWYHGAIQALGSGSPDNIAQTAHSIRELCDRLPKRIADIPEFKSPLPPVKSLQGAFSEAKKKGYADGWEGKTINKDLASLMSRLEEIFKLFNEPPRTARLKLALTSSDPQAEFISETQRRTRDEAFEKTGAFFQKVAHHHLAPTEAQFRMELELFESLLLNYLTPCTATQQKELSALVAGTPTEEALARVNALISHKGANFIFFFERMDNPAWLLLLDQHGYFKDLPEPEPTSDGRLAYRVHVPLIALAKLAPSAPQEVTNILVNLQLPDNSKVGDQVTQCMAKIREAACIKQLRPLITQLSQNTTRTSWLWIEDLLASWAPLKVLPEVIAILKGYLGRAVELSFGQYPDDHNAWLTQQIDERFLGALSLEEPWEVATLMFQTLCNWVQRERQRYGDSELEEDGPSPLWLEDFNDSPDPYRGIEAILAARLYLAAKQIFLKGTISRIDELDQMLRSKQWQLFERLRWQLYADFAPMTLSQARSEVLARIPTLHRIDRGHNHEFVQLLVTHTKQHGSNFLSPDEIGQFVTSVFRGPTDKDGKPIEGYKEEFCGRQLWPIAPLLNVDHLAIYRGFVSDDSKITIDSYKPYRFGGGSCGEIISVAPPEANTLESMSDEQLWSLLNTWRPEAKMHFDSSERWFQQDIFALGAKFAELVQKDSNRFTPSARWWENISRSEIFDKLLEHASQRIEKKRNNEHIPGAPPSKDDWTNWLGITNWVMAHAWPRYAVAGFLTNLSKSDHAIPDFYYSEFPKLLRQLAEEDDPRLEGERNSFRDWLTTAINSVRGDAIEAALNVASRQKAAGREIERWVFDLVRSRLEIPKESPAIFALLGAKLRLLIHLFGQEFKELGGLLFPPTRPEHRAAAVIAHFKYDQPWVAIIKTVPGFIEISLDTLASLRATETEQAKQVEIDFESRLGTHIACYYWHGSLITEEEGDAALDRFFTIASRTARGAVISEIASIWAKPDKSGNDEVILRRVMRIWERRSFQIEKNLKGNSEALSDYDKELAESLDWLDCECFPFEWRFEQAQSALKRLKKAPSAHHLLRSLITFSHEPDRLKAALELLCALLKKPSEGLRWSINTKELAPIISRGLADKDVGINRLAEKCRDLLLRMGFADFLNLNP